MLNARFALGETYAAPEQYPEPFWGYIGWTAERHEFFSSNPRLEALRQRARMQSLAWLAASLLSQRLSSAADGRGRELDSRSFDSARPIYCSAPKLHQYPHGQSPYSLVRSAIQL